MIKKLAYTVIIVIGLASAVAAQPDHIGATYSIKPSDGKDGNGTSFGGAIEASWSIPNYEWLRVKSETRLSMDPKGYRNQNGLAIRSRNVGRAYLPHAQGAFFEAGFYWSHVSFSDTPGTNDGYKKWIMQPIIGAGFEISPHPEVVSAVVEYKYFIPGSLKAKPYDGGATVRDGGSWTHEVEGDIIWSVNNRWAALINARFNRSFYTRDPNLYGQQYNGIKYASNGFEVGFGIAWKFKKK